MWCKWPPLPFLPPPRKGDQTNSYIRREGGPGGINYAMHRVIGNDNGKEMPPPSQQKRVGNPGPNQVRVKSLFLAR